MFVYVYISRQTLLINKASILFDPSTKHNMPKEMAHPCFQSSWTGEVFSDL